MINGLQKREERRHSRISPSKLKHFTNCLGAFALTEHLPDPPSGDAAISGNKTGDFLERYLNESVFDRRFNDLQPTIFDWSECEPDRKQRILTVERYLKNWKKECLEIYKDAQFFYFSQEQLFKAWNITESESVKGSPDIAIAWRVGKQVNIAIMDLKDGLIPVHADNPQLIAYGAGFFRFLVDSGAALPTALNFIHLHILQPRINNFDAKILNSNQFFEEIKNLKSKTELCFSLLGQPPEVVASYLTASSENCTWCKGKKICPEIFKKVNSVFDVILTDKEELTSGKILESLTADEKIKIFQHGKILINLLEIIEAELQEKNNL